MLGRLGSLAAAKGALVCCILSFSPFPPGGLCAIIIPGSTVSSAAATCRQGKLKDLTDCAYTILPQH